VLGDTWGRLGSACSISFEVGEAVMLVVLGVVEQRHAAVLEVLVEGAPVTEVAGRYGVTRQTVHRWLRRYATSGLAGLVDQPSTPRSCPHQMAPELEVQVVALRQAHPGWGPRTIGHQLARQGVAVPGRSSIYRALVRHGLIVPQARRRRRADYRRWERARAMELWQLDVTGGVVLADGTRLQVLTGIDDHSRLCVAATVLVRPTARPVCKAFAGAMRTHGVPEQVLTDNGKVFTGRFGRGSGEVLFDRICRENGIRHLLTAPRSPTTTGKVERFHKTLKREFLDGKTFASIVEAQAALDAWVVHYNTVRPHQGIGMVAPVQRFRLAVPDPLEPIEPVAPAPVEVVAGPDVELVTRKVSSAGTISLDTFTYLAGRWLAGETVQVVSRDGVLEISHRGEPVATHTRRRRAGRVPPSRLQRRPPRPASVGVAVLRKVDSSGAVSFAGHPYRVGNAYKRMSATVTIVGATVQITVDGRLVRTHPIRHDRAKEHGAFANPTGRPTRTNAAPPPTGTRAGGTQVPEPEWNTATGT
jgi:transposase InsO family protein